MDELFFTRFFLFQMVDWPTLVGLIVVSMVYFLAPVAGYLATRRGLLLGSLWVLVAKVGLGLFKTAILFFEVIDRKGNSGGGGGPGSKRMLEGELLYLLFTLLETVLFLLAMVLFVSGLAGLRRAADEPPRVVRRPYDE